MIRTRGRRLVSRLEALERVYDTRGPRVFRVIFEYGGEPTIITYFRDENRTEIIEPPPPDDDPDEFYGAGESPEPLDVSPAPQPDDEIPSSFPVGANASLSISTGTKSRARTPTRPRNSSLFFRKGTACRAHCSTRRRNPSPPFRAAHAMVCDKTGDCPKRRARGERFINDLREARWTIPRFFHKAARSQLCFAHRKGP